MELAIAAAGNLDAEKILELHRLCYQSEASIYQDFSIPPLTQTLESLVAEFATHKFLIARSGPDIVGSVRARASETGCHIGRLIVHPRLQRQGIGSSLMRRIEEEYKTERVLPQQWDLTLESAIRLDGVKRRSSLRPATDRINPTVRT